MLSSTVKTISVIALLAIAWFVYARINAPITYPPGVLIAGGAAANRDYA